MCLYSCFNPQKLYIFIFTSYLHLPTTSKVLSFWAFWNLWSIINESSYSELLLSTCSTILWVRKWNFLKTLYFHLMENFQTKYTKLWSLFCEWNLLRCGTSTENRNLPFYAFTEVWLCKGLYFTSSLSCFLPTSLIPWSLKMWEVLSMLFITAFRPISPP